MRGKAPVNKGLPATERDRELHLGLLYESPALPLTYRAKPGCDGLFPTPESDFCVSEPYWEPHRIATASLRWRRLKLRNRA
jgi:hypothetical protein